MTTYTKFKEYIWLVNTIYHAKSITFAEINKRWIETEMSGGVEMARATFNRHKDAIEDIFGIYIECDCDMALKAPRSWILSLTASNCSIGAGTFWHI